MRRVLVSMTSGTPLTGLATPAGMACGLGEVTPAPAGSDGGARDVTAGPEGGRDAVAVSLRAAGLPEGARAAEPSMR